MHEFNIDRIVKAKLSTLEVPLDPADWEIMLERLNASLYQIVQEKLQALSVSFEELDWQLMAAELDQVFDQQILQSLNNLSLTLDSDDWPLMASQLSEHPLDAAIAKKLLVFTYPFSEQDWNLFLAGLDQDSLITHTRNILSSHTISYDPSDWTRFEEQMDGEFDQSIEEKLVSLEMPFLQEDWSKMATILDGNSFDESIREKIDRHQEPVLQEDWAVLSEQLEAPFDALIKAKLDAHSISPQAGDWRVMSKELSQSDDPVPVLWRWQTYAVAASVGFLLLFSSLGIEKDIFQGLRSGSEQVAQSQLENPSTKSVPTLPAEELEFSADSDQAGSDKTDLEGTGNQQLLAELGPEPQDPLQAVTIDPIHSIPTKLLPTSEPQQVEAAVLDSYSSHNLTARDKKDSNRKIHRISQNRDGFNDLAQPFMRETGLDIFDPMKNKTRPEVRLGWYASTTRTKAELNDLVDNTGYATGLRVEMKIKNGWNLVTGFLYGTKHFSHEYPISEPGYIGSFGKVYGNMSVLELPLLVRYEFPDIHGFSLYGQAGLVTLVSIEESYEDHNPLSPSNASLLSRRVDPDLLDAQTHTWNLNTYPGNIHVALGLRYALSSQLNLEIEPYFQQSLQRTKGSTSLLFRKKLYTSGIGASLIYTFPSESR